MDKIINFIKYNNATVIILAVILILGGGALAAGPEAIGQKETRVQGFNNTALLAADLDKFNMDFKIENIEQDEKYYYATYSFLDLVILDNAWQYQLNSKTQKVSKKIKQDLGEYLAKFLAKHYEARLRELKHAQAEAASAGEQKRFEVTEYSGLIGRTLNLAAKIFPGYEPVVRREIPAPENFNLPVVNSGAALSGGTDNLNKIYNDYVAAHPEIFTGSAGSPEVASSTLAAADIASSSLDSVSTTTPTAESAVPETPAAPEIPIIPEPTSVDIIELPASAELAPTETAPVQ